MTIVIPLVSNYKYRLNLKSKKLKAVSELFNLRNRMVHMSDDYVEGYRLEYERFYDFELHDKSRVKFYSNDKFQDQSLDDLSRYFVAYEEFIVDFYELFPRINYKRFDPKEWLLLIEK